MNFPNDKKKTVIFKKKSIVLLFKKKAKHFGLISFSSGTERSFNSNTIVSAVGKHEMCSFPQQSPENVRNTLLKKGSVLKKSDFLNTSKA